MQRRRACLPITLFQAERPPQGLLRRVARSMKLVFIGMILTLLLSLTVEAQKRAKPRSARSNRAAARETTVSDGLANKPRLIGSPVVIITKNDDKISGTLLDLSAYSVRIKADNLESTIALDTISSLSFGTSAPVSKPVSAPPRPEFAQQADTVISSFQSIAAQLRTNTDYTEYGRLLTELRRAGEQLTARYGATENPTEARVVALLAGALTDYSWARTIWTLKFGRSGDTGVFDTDSPAISDALALYPDLRASSANGNKFSADKIVSGLWRKASEKTDRARSLIAPSR
jgi:hypothetical protein